ncbi:bis-aminopropyl spermidine synthase family protein [Micrococcus sp. FDAARGOS_333]|uniref:bis-aminopropyl spermidine synthase family protein n=1 Tax=Micrococcus sp. FDAARGOS_333 TaxID=1930558 RepID=UPI000B4E7695|nr:bis-aminopropyl spermidine synthase family protein [Micrococcus sp. FDAARGOS_333]PNL17590.1 putative methyltransferase [Micrococcus sp. FDAARGOS_333]
MRRLELLERAYKRFVELEKLEWGEGELAAVRRYTWDVWYRPSRLQFARLVAEYVTGEQVYAGGVPRLHCKVQQALRGEGDVIMPSPMAPEAVGTPPRPLEADPSLGQIVCDLASRARVAGVIRRDFPYGARIALLGDDDLIGCAVASEDYPAVVYDIDPRVGDLTGSYPHLEFKRHDIREPMREKGCYEAVLLDPADGSVALGKWLERADECLSREDGARIYLSVNPWRLGRRWAQVIAECLRYGMIPCNSYPRLKAYPQGSIGRVETDLWVFERTSVPSALPHPYLDIEVFR